MSWAGLGQQTMALCSVSQCRVARGQNLSKTSKKPNAYFLGQKLKKIIRSNVKTGLEIAISQLKLAPNMLCMFVGKCRLLLCNLMHVFSYQAYTDPSMQNFEPALMLSVYNWHWILSKIGCWELDQGSRQNNVFLGQYSLNAVPPPPPEHFLVTFWFRTFDPPETDHIKRLFWNQTGIRNGQT